MCFFIRLAGRPILAEFPLGSRFRPCVSRKIAPGRARPCSPEQQLRGAADSSAAPRPTSPPAGATDAGRRIGMGEDGLLAVLPTSFPAGATDAGKRGTVEAGTGVAPVPRVRCAGGGNECQRNGPDLVDPPSFGRRPGQELRLVITAGSGAAKRNRHEPGPRVGFHTQQHAALAFGAGLTQGACERRAGVVDGACRRRPGSRRPA